MDNFRPFRHLKIKRLARVNLIVGKNNVGKTSLLEALHLYASRGKAPVIWNLLRTREEAGDQQDEASITARLTALKYLFYGRQEISPYPDDNLPPPIKIGSLGSANGLLSIAVGWYKMVYDPNLLTFSLQSLSANQFDHVQAPIPALILQYGPRSVIVRLDEKNNPFLKPVGPELKHIFLSTERVPKSKIKEWRDKAVIADRYEQVDEALRIIAPHVQRTDIVNFHSTERDEQQAVVKLSGQSSYIPLNSLGEGMNRLFEIALTTVNAKDSLLLIDEIDSGLHHAIQADVWRMIFELARRLNIQVFAAL